MDDRLHVGVCRVEGTLVETQVVLTLAADTRLVEDAQHLVETVVDTSVETRYLHEDAVVVEAVDEPVGYSLGDGFVVIVERLVADIHHRLVYLADGVSQQVDGYHRQCVAVVTIGHDVLRVLVVYAQVLSEAERLRGEPCLLKLYQYELFLAVGLTDGGAEVDAEDGEYLLLAVGVFVRPDFHFHDILLQQGREDSAGNAFVLHEVLEHGVVDRVGYCHHKRYATLLQR